MITRRLTESDIKACVEIARLNWDAKIARRARQELKRALAHPDFGIIYLVAVQNGQVIGWAGMMPSWIMHQVWDCIWINIHPDHQGAGVGEKLTKQRIKYIKGQGGTAIHLVTKVPDWFKRFGFQPVFKYKGGWSLMVKQLQMVKL